MSKSSPRGAVTSGALFQAPDTAHPANVARSGKTATLKPKRARVVARTAAGGKADPQFVDGIVNGERVHVYQPPKRESERSVELQARVAIAALGVWVKKHTVEACYGCGARPSSRTGLGTGTSDLLCIVPPLGRVVFIEMKRPGYSPSDVSPEQHAFIRAVKKFGGIAGVASSVEEAVALVKLAMVAP